VRRQTRIVGRQPELEQLAGFVARIPAGLGAFVIGGVPGIGKTTVWRHGLALAETGGCIVLAARPSRAEAELQRVVVRRAPQELTPTEEKIARLAADGLTNRAIAQRAFVSVNTVEADLTRVYRKLGISSRARLSRALDERAPVDS